MTGSPDIPDPPSDAPTDLRGRLRRIRTEIRVLLGTMPRVIGLVWSASRVLTIGLVLATVLTGLVPAATAYVAKLLIDAVVAAITAREGAASRTRPWSVRSRSIRPASSSSWWSSSSASSP